MRLQDLQEAIPHPLQTALNWTSFLAGLGWFFTNIVPAIVGVLSGIWLAIQIFTAWRTKPWRRK